MLTQIYVVIWPQWVWSTLKSSSAQLYPPAREMLEKYHFCHHSKISIYSLLEKNFDIWIERVWIFLKVKNSSHTHNISFKDIWVFNSLVPERSGLGFKHAIFNLVLVNCILWWMPQDLGSGSGNGLVLTKMFEKWLQNDSWLSIKILLLRLLSVNPMRPNDAYICISDSNIGHH